MQRHEFEPILKQFFEALQVKVNRVQAEYFWDAYKGAHVDDFRLACRELGRGTPGRLPTPTFFSENLASAREMRLEREKGQEKRWVQKFLKEGPSHHDPMEDRWAKCCAAIVTQEAKRAAQFVREEMEGVAFRHWALGCTTDDGEIALHWLTRQVERIEAQAKVPSIKTDWDAVQKIEAPREVVAEKVLKCE